jgi:hypothetical protein
MLFAYGKGCRLRLMMRDFSTLGAYFASFDKQRYL